MPQPLVHLVTRKSLVANARVFKQVRSLRAAGADVLLLGVARRGLPERDVVEGAPALRVRHDPLPLAASRWLRRGEAPLRPPADALAAPGAPAPAGASRARRRLLALARAAGTPAWLLQSAAFYARAVPALLRAPRPAVVQATDLNALAPAALVAAVRRVPLVYDAQELYTGLHTLTPAYRRLLAAQERALLRRVDRLVVVNPDIGEVLARATGRRPDAVVLNCPPLRRPTGREPRPAPGSGPLAVYSGGLGPGRGLEQLLHAVALVDELELLLLAEGPLEDALDVLARELGIAARVHRRPYVPHDEVPAVLAGADVGVLPYRDIGVNHRLASPSKLFHYIMAGLPVAASDLPFLRRVVLGHGVGALFDPERPESIAAALRAVLADRERHAAAAAAAAPRFSWEHEEQAYLGAFRSLGVLP